MLYQSQPLGDFIMSNHIFDTRYQDRDVRVTLGYDRPLGHVFLTVLRTESEEPESSYADQAEDVELDSDDDDGVIYSNLSDPDAGFSQGLDYYRAKLTSLAITVPESMFRETEEDALRCAGNRVVRHYEDGRLETLQAG